MVIDATLRRAGLAALLALGPVAPALAAPIKTDFVFVIDATGSMGDEISAVKSGLGAFATGLDASDVDARFAVVLFGGRPELVQDFTAAGDTVAGGLTTEVTLDSISVTGAVAGFQENHNLNPEAGLEAIRIVLGAAPNSTLRRTNVGGAGGLSFRSDARKNLILVTDEDSDQPCYVENRQPGQGAARSSCSTGSVTSDPPSGGPSLSSWDPWQTEIDQTAEAIIDNDAFINMLVNAGDAPSRAQYGAPDKDVSDPDFLNFDGDATLAALAADAFTAGSLQRQVLEAGLIGRSFSIGDVDDPEFIDNFFAAKVEETVDNPVDVPGPATVGLLGLGLLGTAALRRRT